MLKIVFCLGLIALSAAQFPQPDYLNIPGVTPSPWRGPYANHINGIPPADTPEVAAAKLALNQAYAQVLAVLPQLPPEERYQEHSQEPVHHVLAHNIPVIPQYNQHVVHHHVQPAPQHVPVQPTVFAEEIPRSPIGEVPEVHAARVAHLKAVQEANAVLPRLVDTHSQPRHIPQAVVVPTYNQLSGQTYIQDTPEVARAKAEHAAALAALG